MQNKYKNIIIIIVINLTQVCVLLSIYTFDGDVDPDTDVTYFVHNSALLLSEIIDMG